MSGNKPEDKFGCSRSLEEIESPRKSMYSDGSSRKSWSLMDKTTDHEVLQEMGVSLLEPEDSEVLCEPGTSGQIHKAVKRKWDIENVNPNINLSPHSKFSPKSPRLKAPSPNAGPSRMKSPRSIEKHPLQPTELLETYLDSKYLIDEETPMGQSVRASYLPSAGSLSNSPTSSQNSTLEKTPLSLGLKDNLINSRKHRPENMGTDSFNILSDEMILSVFRWLPKRTLAHCMLVCKRWYRIACDDTLWTRLDLGNKNISKGALGRILSRNPVVVRLASSTIGEWVWGGEKSRVHFLDVSVTRAEGRTLAALLAACPALFKLSAESVHLHDTACLYIGKCRNLETLNLSMARGITEKGLKYILSGCIYLQSLNISWCNLDEASVQALVTMLPKGLQRLNISGTRILTDEILERLVKRCPQLVELDLSDCGRLTARSAVALSSLHSLEHLATSRCYLLPAHALYILGTTTCLQYLDVWGMLHSDALSALKTALPHVQINQFMFSAIARPTVGPRRTSIWGLRTRD